MATLATAFALFGWTLWGLALLYGIAMTFSRSPDGGVRSMMRTQGLVPLAACALTAVFPISRW